MRPEEAVEFTPRTVCLKNGASAVLRLLTLDDGERLADFYESVPPEDYHFYCPHPLTRENALAKAAKANDPCFVCLVLETPPQCIGGYAWYLWDESSTKSTFGICVRRNQQGTGAGKFLMTRLFEIAAKIGPPVISLTVQLANPKGVALYRKMGFEVVREQTRAGGMPEPEYYMERKLR